VLGFAEFNVALAARAAELRSLPLRYRVTSYVLRDASEKDPWRDQEVFTWARVAGNGLRKVAFETLERITALRAYAVVWSELQGGGTGHLSVPQDYGR
jgi:hypothetical protein